MALPADIYRKLFVENTKLLDEATFDKVVRNSEQTHRPLDQLLMERAFIVPNQLLQLLGDFYDVPTTQLKVSDVDRSVLVNVTESFATKSLVLPFAMKDGKLHVAMVNPADENVIDALHQMTKVAIVPYVALDHAIKRALVLYDGSINEILEKMLKDISEHPIDGDSEKEKLTAADLVNSIVEAAILVEASDIHIEPFETEVIIRFRIDGMLRTVALFPTSLHGGLLAALKVTSKLRLDQKRLPQDGRFSINAKGQEVGIRISTVPSLWGEKIVMRVLPKEAHLFDLTSLGLLDADLELVKAYAKKPYGMILTCGPTGSGKTSTLYALLQEIGSDRIDVVNMSTIEDPIEYTIPRVTQIQTQPDIDLTFASGLRALLRQDPDIIMVGEIRDKETADFSVRASLVGRLLLSSLHTNDAVGAIPRLLDLGIEPYMISSTLSLVIAQRLARKLCIHCRESYKPDASLLQNLTKEHGLTESLKSLEKKGIISKGQKAADLRFYKSNGCDYCSHTGYSGRTGIYEILEVTDRLRSSINQREDITKLITIATEDGMKSMFQDGLVKVMLGVIGLEELLRVAYS